MVEYRNAVLLKFNLFSSLPIMLLVEGKTEENLLNMYLETREVGYNFLVKNIGGSGNTSHFLRLLQVPKNQVFFFFLDYDSKDNYKHYSGLIGKSGDFFYPDFITENFNVSEIVIAYKNWLNKIGINMGKIQEKELIQQLRDAKKKSNSLCRAKIKAGKIEGFEKVLTNFSKTYYSQEIINHYPKLRIHEKSINFYKKQFTQKLKEEIAENHLNQIVKESIENDPERKSRKFPFEEKLQPFFKKIYQMVERNRLIRYPFLKKKESKRFSTSL